MYELLEELIAQNLHLRGGEEPNLIELDETSYQLLMVDLKSNICPLGNSHSPNIKVDTVSFRSGITCNIVNTGLMGVMSISIKREEENKGQKAIIRVGGQKVGEIDNIRSTELGVIKSCHIDTHNISSTPGEIQKLKEFLFGNKDAFDLIPFEDNKPVTWDLEYEKPKVTEKEVDKFLTQYSMIPKEYQGRKEEPNYINDNSEEKRIGPMSNWSEDDGKGFDSSPMGGFSNE